MSIEPVVDKKPIDHVKGDKVKVTFEGGMSTKASISVCIRTIRLRTRSDHA